MFGYFYTRLQQNHCTEEQIKSFFDLLYQGFCPYQACTFLQLPDII